MVTTYCAGIIIVCRVIRITQVPCRHPATVLAEAAETLECHDNAVICETQAQAITTGGTDWGNTVINRMLSTKVSYWSENWAGH